MAAKKKKTKGTPAPKEPSKRAAELVDQARLYFEGIVETVRNPLVVLDGELRVRSCNRGFYKMFHVTEQETIGRLMYDLGNRQWDIPALRRLLEEILPQKKQVVDFKVTHRFELIGERTMLLNACVLPSQGEGANQILLAIEDITDDDRMEAELERRVADRTAELRQSQEQLAVILNTAVDAIITINRQGIIQSINPAAERMFGYTAAQMIGQNVKMLMPSAQKEEHDSYLARYFRTGEKHIIGIGREVQARHQDGSIFPVDLAVSEVADLGLFTGILRDLSQRQGLEHEVVEIAALERQRIGQYLHDDCGQELTALGLLADSLVETLAEHAPADVEIARKIGQGLMRLLLLVRNMSRGLARAEIDPAGLPQALTELTARLSETSGVRCVFHGDKTLKVEDRLRATHLFHIAQEACTNALKHSHARNVEIWLRSADHTYTLEIQDDGVGISQEAHEGLGLRIMRNRAGIIGATLTIELVKPQGTIVKCVLRKK
jgi:PAS domain S-box-containing protein